MSAAQVEAGAGEGGTTMEAAWGSDATGAEWSATQQDVYSSRRRRHPQVGRPHDHVYVPPALQGVEFRRWASIVRAFMVDS